MPSISVRCTDCTRSSESRCGWRAGPSSTRATMRTSGSYRRVSSVSASLSPWRARPSRSAKSGGGSAAALVRVPGICALVPTLPGLNLTRQFHLSRACIPVAISHFLVSFRSARGIGRVTATDGRPCPVGPMTNSLLQHAQRRSVGMSHSTWSRWFRRTPRPLTAGGPVSRRQRRSSLGVERLEERTVPTLFATLASGLEAKLNQLDAALDTIGSVHHLPVVDQPLTDLPDANNAFKTIKNAFDLPGLSVLDTDAVGLQDFLYTALTSGPVNLLGDLNQDSQIVKEDDLLVTVDPSTGNVEVTLRLTKNVADGPPAAADFGLGLPGVPFAVTPHVDPADKDVLVRVGFDYEM